jgi:subtilisin family serine protease
MTAYVSVKSVGGVSLFSGLAKINSDTAGQFVSTPEDTAKAASLFESKGFQIDTAVPSYVRISAPASHFEQTFGIRFEKKDVPLAEFAAPLVPTVPWTPTVKTSAKLLDTGIPGVEGIVFPQPICLHGYGATPPALTGDYFHLEVPRDVCKWMGASSIHANGFTGAGVSTAMIDTGFYWDHPYFQKSNYSLGLATPADKDDSDGHGTGQSANLLAVAPEAEMYGIGMNDLVEALNTARALGVQVLSNSWGTFWDTDGPNGTWDPFWSLLQKEIALCVRSGMIVLFSAGNGQVSFTASMPETISVGGVYVDEYGQYWASSYASSFDSFRFQGQHVPEVCGLTGLAPRAMYIALPVPPNSKIDATYGGTHPPHDGTTTDDGWAVFSGTSAACPMVAGVVALILSKYPGCRLDEVRTRLHRTIEVTQGNSAMGDSAGPGWNRATGFGLVNAERAIS